MVFSPMNRPMPWSAWTTMSPADSDAASAMKSEAFLRFLERRTRRSPRMSCSATTAKPVGFEAGFERQHGGARLPRLQLCDIGERGDRLDVAKMMLGQNLRQAVERALGPARDDDAAACRAHRRYVLDGGVEDVGVGVGALLGEAVARA